MRPLILLSVFSAAIALMAACGQPPRIDEGAQFHSVEPRGWTYGETFEFSPVPEPDSCESTASLAVAVRHTDAYRYGNLWLELTTPAAGSDSVVVDTIDLKLADSYGRWLGRGVGVSFVAVDTLPGRYVYRPGAPARIRHIMRVDTVADIEQVGLIYFDIQPSKVQPSKE